MATNQRSTIQKIKLATYQVKAKGEKETEYCFIHYVPTHVKHIFLHFSLAIRHIEVDQYEEFKPNWENISNFH